jgi:ferredoxin
MAKKYSSHCFVRWLIQLAFLAFFIFLFIQTRYGIPVSYQKLFLRIDPLIAIIVSIATRAVIVSALLSLVIIIITLVFGRIFCGYVCPLGTSIDIAGARVEKKQVLPRFVTNSKYAILFFLFIAAIAGGSFVHFFDPLVIFERTLTLVLYPFYTYFAGAVTLIESAVYTETFVVLAVFLTVLGLNLIAPRLWCRVLCPLGALLALLSKYSIFKFAITQECTQCGLCESVCPTYAIKAEKKMIDSGECIGCFRCYYECAHNAVSFRPRFVPASVNIQRRQLLMGLGAGIIAVPLARSLLHRKLHGRLIRPPGSIPEADFLNACVHCGKCMKACPTNGLQPCVFETGINGLWSPRLIPRIGGCEKNCNLCGQVCPTSAIRELSLEEKTFVKMGTAVIDRSRCIAWEQDKVCLICDEACPYNAISSFNETIRESTLLRPFVDERICTGCGLCEARCPIEGPAAIQVFSIGEERKSTGSYITEEKIKLRACEEKPEDIPSGFFFDE